jgi:hypothetical protein
LVTEVTPGLLAGEEPDAHQFYVTVCLYMGWPNGSQLNDIIPTPKLGQACIREWGLM